MFPYTGYGKDGLALIDLFLRAGFDVHVDPDGVAPPIPQAAALLLTKPGASNYDMQLKQFDPIRLKAWKGEKARTPLLIGWTMWEWSSLDARTSEETLDRLPAQYAHFDSIAMYDGNSRNAVEPYIPASVHRMTAQGGYDANNTRVVQRDFTARPFKFLMYGALTPRKGPFYAINAFTSIKKRRPDLDIELHLKTSEIGLHPRLEEVYPGVKIYNAVWSQQQMDQLIAECHCLLCPSLGEGKNMAAMEFAASGGPVIATDWGGHTVWLNSEFAYPLRCTEVRDKPTFEALRAEPDVQHLEELMEFVIDNPEDVKRKSLIATRLMPQMFSWEATVVNMFARMSAEGIDAARPVLEQLRRGLDYHR
jgi:glycosyltransferase involved in cell wall biosynthesis